MRQEMNGRIMTGIAVAFTVGLVPALFWLSFNTTITPHSIIVPESGLGSLAVVLWCLACGATFAGLSIKFTQGRHRALGIACCITLFVILAVTVVGVYAAAGRI